MEHLLVQLFEFRDNIKLFHFQTPDYGAHIASDQLEQKFTPLIDRLMEVYQGRTNKRVGTIHATLKLDTMNANSKIEKYCETFHKFLHPVAIQFAQQGFDDLANIVADMQAEISQFLYLLTFQ